MKALLLGFGLLFMVADIQCTAPQDIQRPHREEHILGPFDDEHYAIKISQSKRDEGWHTEVFKESSYRWFVRISRER